MHNLQATTMMKNLPFCTKNENQNREKRAIFYQNLWSIANKNHEKCALFDQTAWSKAHLNHDKCAISDQNATTIASPQKSKTICDLRPECMDNTNLNHKNCAILEQSA